MSKTILVVDDDEMVGQVLGRVLSQHGCMVKRAASVAQGLEAARDCLPEIALLDLCLPDGDGLELAKQLKKLVPHILLILITAYPMRLREKPQLAGEFIRILTKPLDLAELRDVVDGNLQLCG